MSGFKLHVMDLRGWQLFSGKARPGPVSIVYPTMEEALAAKAALPVHDDLVATITAMPPPRSREPRRKRASPTEPDGLGGRMHSNDRRLTL